ncbi:murein biosynthesis integral membrane protein MurJ [Oscillochloris sp. ZM17-4]|nr:lipid II flippase MurJ [Oscillochloris sp. ZM17-4]MBX0327924.1 murein biosynthesis integral membrane protein MurJ [Oscillochloris sp. ZM17-4]
MLAFLGSAAFGVVRQILFNAQFGLSDAAGAYYAAFRLPDTINTLVSGGALTNALVPVLVAAYARGGDAAARRVLNLALTVLLGVAGALGLAAALAAPAFVRVLLAPGLDPATQALTVSLTRIMLLEVMLVVAESGLVALLVSRNQLLLPALAAVLHNIAMIGGIVAAMIFPQVGIYGPTVGAILDALIKLALLAPGLRGRGYRLRLLWAPGDRDLRTALRLLVPNAISSGVNYSGVIVDTALSTLSGQAAALGAIQNAYLLVGLPIRMLGVAIGQAALPRLSALSLAGDMAGMRRALRRALLAACGMAALAALALIALGRPMIRMLFERGAFDVAAGDLTYLMLAAYSLGLPAYVATEVLTRAMISRLDTRTPLITNLLQLGLRVALLLPLIGLVGPVLVPLVFAASSAVEAVILYIIMRRRLA